MPDSSTLLDTSALIALLKPDDAWHEAAAEAFIKRKRVGIVYIDDVVFAEASSDYEDQKIFQTAIDELGIARITASSESLFRAGKVFREYRQGPGGGKKDGVLPDFIIGAIAETQELVLVTANTKDFVKKFPKLVAVALDK